MAEDIRKMFDTSGVKAFEKKFEKPYCVLMDSEYCSMGRMIAMKAAEAAGYAYYDSVILLDLIPEEGISKEDVDAYENSLRRAQLSREEIISDPVYQRISSAFDKAVEIALKKGPCLIHDRAVPEKIRAQGYSVFTVMNYATDLKNKIERAKKSPVYQNCTSDEEFIEKIREEDNIRINWHRAHSDTVWGDKNAYDLCLNAETLGRDYAAVILAEILEGPLRD